MVLHSLSDVDKLKRSVAAITNAEARAVAAVAVELKAVEVG